MAAPPGPEYTLRGHESAVNCCSFAEGPRSAGGAGGADDDASCGLLLSGSVDGTIKVWQLDSRRATTRRSAHSHSVVSIAALPGPASQQFITAGRDECVKLWDTETMAPEAEPLLTLHSGGKHFCNTAVDTGSDSGASASAGASPQLVVSPAADEHRALLWDTRTGTVSMEVHTAKEKGTITALHLHSGDLYVGTEDGTISSFDLRGGNGGRTAANGTSDAAGAPNSCMDLHLHDKQPVMALDVAPGGRTVVSGAADAELVRTDLQPGGEGWGDTTATPTITRTALPSTGTSSVRIRGDGRIVASGHWDSTVRIFALKGGNSAGGGNKNNKGPSLKPLAVLTHHTASVFSVAFRGGTDIPGGAAGVFATASKDSTIAVWALYANTYKNKNNKNLESGEPRE